MSQTKGHFAALAICLLTCVTIAWADIIVSINVNKPIYDVSEQFVSFSIPPELLYKSLDGPNKKTLSDMASRMGPSYLRLTGNYFFPSDLKSKLKKPTQSIWSGFNRWTRAMNWTMIIPVQYTPLSWDPIDALRVLNISNAVGIDNCIWQLGLDFGASRAADYVADLNTLDTMVDTFRPYVKNWKVIGADVTAGSSAEETKRYIDIAKDVNTAFGWTQPAGYHIEENLSGYIYDKDASLKAMMEKKVPIWLSIPPKGSVNQMPKGYTTTEVFHAISWAQTLGDAASSGFDAVFKPLTTEDVNAPNYSFYVTSLFKKVMGNRVFAAKPLKRLPYATKLYTHCANGISGGIAFMGVNTEDYPVKVSARLSAKFTGSEVWQFILNSKKGKVYLNNEELKINSTLEPFIKMKHPNKPLAISMPPLSVGFWVLPLANHEDCQFTELLSSYNPEAQWESRQRRQTSSDRLLKKLILETSLTDQMKNRRRRDTSSNHLNKRSLSTTGNLINRQRRFILQDTPVSDPAAPIVSPPLLLQERNLKKRENAQNWFRTLVMNPIPNFIPNLDWNLRRSRRNADFLNSLNPSVIPVPAKLNPVRQLSMKQKYGDEASIFKKPTYNGMKDIPEGDVHFRYITDADGEEISIKESQEEIDEPKDTSFSGRELPTEFYETIAYEKYQSKPIDKPAFLKPKNNGISDIEGFTKYMTRNQLENTFDATQKKHARTYSRPESSDEQQKPKSGFGSEFTIDSYPFIESDDSRKETLESNEGDLLKAYLAASKFSSPRATSGRRIRRAIDAGKVKSWQDNLISNERDTSDIDLEKNENPSQPTVVVSEAKLGVAANMKKHFADILSAVKDHLSAFINKLKE